jgi:hypothetical protein
MVVIATSYLIERPEFDLGAFRSSLTTGPKLNVRRQFARLFLFDSHTEENAHYLVSYS